MPRVANWYERHATKDGFEQVPAHPPMPVMKDMLARPNPPLPILERITEMPVFSATGRLIATPGYDAESHILFAPASGFTVPELGPRRYTELDTSS